jgi:uncharacterized protein
VRGPRGTPGPWSHARHDRHRYWEHDDDGHADRRPGGAAPGSAQGLAEVTRTERRTGIEGWFDAPVHAATEVRATAPPRWKQATTIWLVFFPLNLLATVTLGALLADVHVVLRVAVTTLALTPVMTYLLLPWITRRLEWWLRPARRRG